MNIWFADLHVPDGHVGAVLPPTEIRGDIVRQLHRVRVVTTHGCNALQKSKQCANLVACVARFGDS